MIKTTPFEMVFIIRGYMATFSERLRCLRKERDLSQMDLAKQLSISKSSINMYERGEREPCFETLESIADYFNVDMDYLLGKSNFKNKNAWLCSTDRAHEPIDSLMKGALIIKKVTTSQRLKEIMESRHLKQVDILTAAAPFCRKYDVKLGKNDLSQYVSGKVLPGQDKLTILGLALNVSEAWLMGFDVPADRSFSVGEAASAPTLTPSELSLLSGFRELNTEGQTKALSYVEDLLRAGIYKNNPDFETKAKQA